jgi:hypothetical protein
VTAVPAALQGLASPASSTSSGSTSGLSDLLNTLTGNSTSTTGFAGLFNELFSSSGLGLNANIWNTIFSSGFYMPSNTLGAFTSLFGGAAAGEATAGDALGEAAGAAADGLGGAVAVPTGGLGGAVSAALGRGTAIGALAVPPSWDAIAPTTSPIAPLLGGAPIGAPAAVPGMPGMPAASAAGNHLNGAVPKYGFRPTVVAHSPAAG